MISIRLRLLYRRLSYLTGFFPGFPTRNARGNAFLCKGIAEPVGVVTPFAQQPVCFGQAIQQGCSAGVIADLQAPSVSLSFNPL